jgi:hypothetical protein
MTTQIDAAPVQPADYFSNPQSRAYHFAALVKHHESATQVTAPPAEPNAEDIALLDETVSKGKLADGRPAMLHNSQFRREVESLRADVLSGKRLDVTSAKARIAAALGIEPASAPAPATEVESPSPHAEWTQDRLDAVASRIDAGEAVPVAELPESALSGYRLTLPDGWGIGAQDIAMLEAARAADIPQEIVDRYVAALVRGAP